MRNVLGQGMGGANGGVRSAAGFAEHVVAGIEVFAVIFLALLVMIMTMVNNTTAVRTWELESRLRLLMLSWKKGEEGREKGE